MRRERRRGRRRHSVEVERKKGIRGRIGRESRWRRGKERGRVS